MSFYVAVHSDASRSTFKGNTAAHFTTRLDRHIILNREYNVAVNSIMKYRRDGVDAALSRVSRDVKVETSTVSSIGSTTPPHSTRLDNLQYYPKVISRISNDGQDQKTVECC